MDQIAKERVCLRILDSFSRQVSQAFLIFTKRSGKKSMGGLRWPMHTWNWQKICTNILDSYWFILTYSQILWSYHASSHSFFLPMKFIILFLLVLLVILIFLTALVSWFTFPFLFLPPLGRSKVKGGLPIPSFFELADHGDHVIQVKANPSLHILSNGQSLCLYTQFLGSHQTSIL